MKIILTIAAMAITALAQTNHNHYRPNFTYEFGRYDDPLKTRFLVPCWVAVTNQLGDYKIISSNFVTEIVFQQKTNVVVLAEQKTNVVAIYSPPPQTILFTTNAYWRLATTNYSF